MTDPTKEIKIGTLVQTIFGSRVCKVTAIEAVVENGKPEPYYNLEYGHHDFVNNFKPLPNDKPSTLKAIRSEITKVL